MLISETSLIIVFLLSLLCLKHSKFVRYIFPLLILSSFLVFYDEKGSLNLQLFLHKNSELFRFVVIFAGSILAYINDNLKRRIAIIVMICCVNTMLICNNILVLLVCEEIAVFSSYYVLYNGNRSYDFSQANYFKYNVLASSLWMLFGCALMINTNAVNFDDIRFSFAILKDDNAKALLIIVPLVLSFFVRIGLFNQYIQEQSNGIFYEKLATVFALLIPVNSLMSYCLMTNIFNYTSLNDVFRLVAYIAMMYSGMVFYRSRKFSTLLSNLVSFNAGMVLLCCSLQDTYSDFAVYLLCTGNILVMLGMVSLVIAVRKKFNRSIEYIADFSSIGARHKKIGILLSLLCLCIISLPPSLNFWGMFWLYFSAISQHLNIGLALVAISIILIMIKGITIISDCWRTNKDIFFSVVNEKLTNMMYVIIIIGMVMLPFMCGVLRNSCYAGY